jgi:hypothetical protein
VAAPSHHRDHFPSGRRQANIDGRHQRILGPIRQPDSIDHGGNGDFQCTDDHTLHCLPEVFYPGTNGGALK